MRYAGSDACTDEYADECTDGCAIVGTNVHPERSTYISADGVTDECPDGNANGSPDCSTYYNSNRRSKR